MTLDTQNTSFARSAVRVTTDFTTSGYRIGSSISGVDIPVFDINTFTWLENPRAALPAALLATMFNDSSLIFGTGKNPLSNDDIAVATILNPTDWEPQNITTLPPATTVMGIRYAAMIVGRALTNATVTDDYCTHILNYTSTTSSNSLPSTYLAHTFSTGYTNCYAIASLHISAGTIKSAYPSTTLLTSKLLGCTAVSTSTPVESHPLTDFTISMMPEVMQAIASLGILDTGDAVGYLSNLTVLAYQGAWSASVQYLNTAGGAGVDVYPSTTSTRAYFNRTAVGIWIVMNLLLPLAGVVVMIVQRQCRGKTVTNPLFSGKSLFGTSAS